MRLTKTMKESLLTIIKNRTKNPVKQETLDDILNRFQAKVYELEPALKQFIDAYPRKREKHHSYVGVHIEGKSRYGSEVSFFLTHPYDNFYAFFLPSVYDLPSTTRITTHYYKHIIAYEECSEHLKPEFKPFFDELYELAVQQDQYTATLEELEAHINSFTTDTALLKAYPEFEEFFTQAGITKTAKRYLPSVTGLPNSLTNYGLTFKNAEPTEKQEEPVPETVTEELQSLGHNV